MSENVHGHFASRLSSWRKMAAVARPMMRLTATFDHRFVDGFQAGRLGSTFERVMHDPASCLDADEVGAPVKAGPAARAPTVAKTA